MPQKSIDSAAIQPSFTVQLCIWHQFHPGHFCELCMGQKIHNVAQFGMKKRKKFPVCIILHEKKFKYHCTMVNFLKKNGGLSHCRVASVIWFLQVTTVWPCADTLQMQKPILISFWRVCFLLCRYDIQEAHLFTVDTVEKCFKILLLRKWRGCLIICAWKWIVRIEGAVLECVKIIGNIYKVPVVSFVHSSAFYLQICFSCFTRNKQTHSLTHMHAHSLGS